MVFSAGEKVDRLRFSGFDLKDPLEGRFLSYVRYLLATERWEEVAPRLVEIGDNGNAHHPCLPMYRRMLEEYQPILASRRADRGYSSDSWLLGVDDLRRVAARWANRRVL